jgi:universal stress protein A
MRAATYNRSDSHPWRLQETTMRDYKKILLCLDLTDDSEKLAERAKALAATFGAELTLLHVVEYVPVEPMGEALLPAVQIEGELVERAKVRLSELSAKLGLERSERLIQTGNIKTEVVRIAQERHADLIVIGSRERHGVSILFNFTEDTVLHAAPCDVLAVRLAKG